MTDNVRQKTETEFNQKRGEKMTDKSYFNRHENETLYFVAIEWDGEQPSSTWYDVIHKLGIYYRGDGDKSVSPLERRDTGDDVGFQEGLIFTASETLARSLAFMARDEFGAAAVAIGEAVARTRFTMNREDHAIMERLARTIRKRGRKPKPQKWVVTCLEEMASFEIETPAPVNCPHCRGMRIRSRVGTPNAFSDDGDDIFRLWVRTRFASPHWEPTPVDMVTNVDPEPPAFDEIEMGNAADVEFVAGLEQSEIVEQIANMDRAEQLRVIDAIYVARRVVDPAKRQTARINAISAYFQTGGTRSDFAMAETPVPDLLDTASIMGSEFAGELWRGVMAAK